MTSRGVSDDNRLIACSGTATFTTCGLVGILIGKIRLTTLIELEIINHRAHADPSEVSIAPLWCTSDVRGKAWELSDFELLLIMYVRLRSERKHVRAGICVYWESNLSAH